MRDAESELGATRVRRQAGRGRWIGQVVAIALCATANPASAVVMGIQTNDPALNADGLCSIREAFENANADSQVHADCPAGSGADVVQLGGRTIVFDEAPAAYDDLGHNALPPITGDTITLANGQLVRDTAITHCDATVFGDRTEFRLLRVGSTGTLNTNFLVLRNGCASDVTEDAFDTQGGGIMADGSVTLRRTAFFANTGSAVAALFARGPSVTMVDSVVAENIAGSTGHSVDLDDVGDILIANSSFHSNLGQRVVWMENWTASARIINSTIASNEGKGLLIVQQSGVPVDLTNNTIAGNGNRGYDFQTGQAQLVVVNLSNNVLVGNVNGDCGRVTNQTVTTNASNNVYGSDGDPNTCTGFATDVNNIVPLLPASMVVEMAGGLAVLSDNGGPSVSVALAAFSPALDAGDQTLLPSELDLGIDLDADGFDDPIDVDQRGFPRVVGIQVDAGAVENVVAEVPVPTFGSGPPAWTGALIVGMVGLVIAVVRQGSSEVRKT